ncbi:MAG TPA: hypothetical protein VFW94_23850 [Candidatus Acidoferrales bacterium]|nr:hypothetical protein [Candidatus Acidoferrales bacterium]
MIVMVRRQHNICCLFGIAPTCPGRMADTEASFDHEHGRGAGGGKRDDRIAIPVENLDRTITMKNQNGAAHTLCNQWKGSRYIPYNDPEALAKWKEDHADDLAK